MANIDAEAETAAVRRLVAEVQEHQNDLDRFLSLHTADTSIVNFVGRRVRGKDVLHRTAKAALESPLAKVTSTAEIEDIRFVRPDVAIVAAVKRVFDGREDSPPDALPASSGWITYVVAKEHDAWRIVSAQTTPIME
ncbi:SgcJ/EcaC family oxidoreductase [Actinomadura monticuli]|uniref:SgcJ/EcaC family oxidoreductase n=1 Tax=Actinomadura monticuli TaxID=3097367 RepID=A0ABV4QIF2_9ACTN